MTGRRSLCGSTSVFERNRHGFLEVLDQSNNSQDIFVLSEAPAGRRGEDVTC
ncbi:MAG TPA: hypothetical protein VF101_12110 [Gaiellaceae bacterium]